MLFEDSNFTAQLENAIRPEVDRFHKKIEACLEDMRAKNLLHSSITIDRLSAICRQSFQERLVLAWQALSDCARGEAYRPGLVDELECYLDEHVPSLYPDMLAVVEQAQGFADPGEPAFKNFEASICEGRFAAFRKIKPLMLEFCAAIEQRGNGEVDEVRGIAPDKGSRQKAAMLDMESYGRRDELGSSLFALEFAICGLADADFKQKMLPTVRAVRSEIGRPRVEVADFCRLIRTVAEDIADKPELAENYVDLKALVADLGIILP